MSTRWAGIKKGLEEVIAFYDKVGKILAESNTRIEKLAVTKNDNYSLNISIPQQAGMTKTVDV